AAAAVLEDADQVAGEPFDAEILPQRRPRRPVARPVVGREREQLVRPPVRQPLQLVHRGRDLLVAAGTRELRELRRVTLRLVLGGAPVLRRLVRILLVTL